MYQKFGVNHQKLIHLMGFQNTFSFFCIFIVKPIDRLLSDQIWCFRTRTKASHDQNNSHKYFSKNGEKKDKTICSKYICERFLRKLAGDNSKCQQGFMQRTLNKIIQTLCEWGTWNKLGKIYFPSFQNSDWPTGEFQEVTCELLRSQMWLKDLFQY